MRSTTCLNAPGTDTTNQDSRCRSIGSHVAKPCPNISMEASWQNSTVCRFLICHARRELREKNNVQGLEESASALGIYGPKGWRATEVT